MLEPSVNPGVDSVRTVKLVVDNAEDPGILAEDEDPKDEDDAEGPSRLELDVTDVELRTVLLLVDCVVETGEELGFAVDAVNVDDPKREELVVVADEMAIVFELAAMVDPSEELGVAIDPTSSVEEVTNIAVLVEVEDEVHVEDNETELLVVELVKGRVDVDGVREDNPAVCEGNMVELNEESVDTEAG